MDDKKPTKKNPARNPVSKLGKNSDKPRLGRKKAKDPSDTGEFGAGGMPIKKGKRKNR